MHTEQLEALEISTGCAGITLKLLGPKVDERATRERRQLRDVHEGVPKRKTATASRDTLRNPPPNVPEKSDSRAAQRRPLNSDSSYLVSKTQVVLLPPSESQSS